MGWREGQKGNKKSKGPKIKVQTGGKRKGRGSRDGWEGE
jgi:hypothetical protein